VIIWNATEASQNKVLSGHSSKVACLAFSRDGVYLVSCSDDSTAIIWNLEEGSQSKVLKGHSGPVTCLAFNDKGNYLVTASDDSSAIIWNFMKVLNLKYSAVTQKALPA
jgi:WD40 repeat protein